MNALRDPNRSLFGRVSFSVVLALLAAMILMATLLAISELRDIGERQAARTGASVKAPVSVTISVPAQIAPPAPVFDLIDVTPPTPWKSLDPAQKLTRIGLGSCLHQDQTMPIWQAIIAARPDVFLMLGDNVYGDIKQGDANELARAYVKLTAEPMFAAARAAFPFLATWDDHDYGINDGGAGYEFQPEAAHLFRQFWARDEAKQPDGGIYYSRIVGPPGQRVQFVFLDTRTFKSPFTRKGADFPHWGKYRPDADTKKTILGDTQWAWLRGQLNQEADIRIVASGIQILANGHGWERWGNLPAERAKLMSVIRESEAGGVIFVSGDRHSGAHYQRAITPNASGQTIIPELTASSLNRSFGPSKDARMKPLISGPHHVENFGMIEIDWSGQSVAFRLKGIGDLDDVETLSFAELGTGIGSPEASK